ncbi:MAG: TRAP transporter small permease [Duodenibacillus sp.]|nr:TRAP transporter small permease [Duodenibacillus sp.]
MKLLNYLNRVVTAFAGLTLAFMTVLVILQVFYRYVLKAPFPESQELAVYAMVYVVMFGSTIAVYKKTHIAVNFFLEKASPKVAFALRVVAYAALLYFFYLLVRHGYALTLRSMRQLSPSTGIPVGYIMASVPISAAISFLYVAEQLALDVRQFVAGMRK